MRRWALFTLTTAATVVILRAQQPATPPQSAALFRTGVEYVSVDVVVTDKNDKPVTDLRKDEFVITENKKPQTIRDFQYFSVPVQHRTIDVTVPQPPEPDVATNVPPSPKSRLFALVIDDLHILEADLVPMKGVMRDFVSALSPDDEVAIVFVGRSDLSQNFTTNTGRLLKTIDRLKDALGFGMDAMGHTRTVGLFDGMSGLNPLVLNYARSTTSVLKNVSASLAGSGHARRAIVYVGNGTNLKHDPSDGPDGITLFEEMTATFEEARRADVPIYTLDPRGMVDAEGSVRGGIGAISGKPDPTLPQPTRLESNPDPHYPPAQFVRQEITNRFRVEQDFLATVAINTGGRAFTNQSNLTRAIDEIVGENGSYYLLGYSPDPLVRDGKFHDIDVKVTRPGLIVRPRKGYVAPSATPTTTDARPTLDKAMSAGVSVSGLTLRAFAAPVSATAAGMATIVTVELTYPAPADGSKEVSDTLEMSVVALDPDAKMKASSARKLHFNTAVIDGAATVSFLINDTIALPSQPLTLRIGVASQSLGRAGTIQLPVDVPKPGDSKLQLGGVVIGFADFGRQPTLQRELISPLLPFQPTTARTFAATDVLRVFGRAFWGSKDAGVDAILTLGGATGRAPQLVHVNGAPSAGNASRREGTLTTLLPLKGLAPGSYTLHVEAKLANGQTARRDVPFEVK